MTDEHQQKYSEPYLKWLEFIAKRFDKERIDKDVRNNQRQTAESAKDCNIRG